MRSCQSAPPQTQKFARRGRALLHQGQTPTYAQSMMLQDSMMIAGRSCLSSLHGVHMCIVSGQICIGKLGRVLRNPMSPTCCGVGVRMTRAVFLCTWAVVQQASMGMYS